MRSLPFVQEDENLRVCAVVTAEKEEHSGEAPFEVTTDERWRVKPSYTSTTLACAQAETHPTRILAIKPSDEDANKCP
jgi:hypothetical protein